jgi:carbonic anhydrase
MDVIATFTKRNEAFSQHRFTDHLKMLPSLRTMIIGCVDPRVDPFELFALEPGEAAVIRNVGGRVTPNIFQTLGLLRVVSKVNGAEVGRGWNLIVLHHTDCGIRCLHEVQEPLAAYLGAATSGLEGMAIDDPFAAVAVDVAALKASPKTPAGLLVTGMVYDVATGLVKIVVPSAPLHPEIAR